MIRQVYFARVIGPHGVSIGAIKIGCSFGHDARLVAIASSQPYTLELLTTAPGDMLSEAVIHLILRAHRISGEFFHENCVVMEYIERVQERGSLFEYIAEAPGADNLPVQATQAFLDFHGLTLADVCRRLQRPTKPFAGKPDAMRNRKFVAAALLEAVNTGPHFRYVQWPRDCVLGLLGQKHFSVARALPPPRPVVEVVVTEDEAKAA